MANPNRRRQSNQPKPELDHATRIWAELAIIELGSCGIVRHLRSLVERRSLSRQFCAPENGRRSARLKSSQPAS